MYNLSVVIPVYNARDYIIGCISGILSQDLEGIEVVVVNDCSTDGSMDLCRAHFGGNGNVQLVDQPRNTGPGGARNTGIRKARGRYVTFVDSDDAVRPGAYRAMLEAADREDADVLHATGVLMQTVDDAPADLNQLTEDEVVRVTLDRDNRVSGSTVITGDIGERLDGWLAHKYHWAIWNKLYRREFLLENGILFGEMKFAEDQVFCFHCLCRAEKYVMLPGEWYLYRIGADSLSHGRKNAAFMVKALTSQLETPACMEKAMSGIDYFERNPARKKEAVQYVFNAIEAGFVVPTFREAGIGSLKSDEGLHGVFVSRFGENAAFAEYQFYKAHENIPDEASVYDMITSPAFWRRVKKNRTAVAELSIGSGYNGGADEQH